MRDIITIRSSALDEIIIGTDNSGGIGTKEEDFVVAEDDLTAYFSARVALMEVMSAKGIPFSVLLHNFSGDDRWEPYCKGIERALTEAGAVDIPVSGSSESNFPLRQSALGVTVLGKREISDADEPTLPQMGYAVIGQPLVGNLLLERMEKAAPLSLFSQCCQSPLIEDIIPVGSKGILEELKVISKNKELIGKHVSCSLDINISGGPSTCFIINFAEKNRYLVEGLTGNHYHPILIAE
jgi:hypothetical protein